jgi:uncharacterized protein YggE
MINNTLKIIAVFTGVIFVTFFAVGVLNISSAFRDQISVSGTAKKDFSNQIAEFTLTFTSENKDKEVAETENNEKVNKFLEDVRNFGIPEEDIITDNLNVYQKQEDIWNPMEARNKYELTDWVFSQSIRVKIKDVTKVNEFTNLATRNETSNIYGPNFSLDSSEINEGDVFNLAFENAKQKAENLASKSGRTLGKVILISEGTAAAQPFPLYTKAMGFGGEGSPSAELPIGTTEVSKTLNIIFELR